MFAILPDFTPRDSHALWYTSSRAPFPSGGPRDAQHADLTTANGGGNGPNSTGHGSHPPRSRGHVLERTALARLATDEQHLHRRRLNVQNFGSGWLRPPGIPKTLHQMREEKREQEEHQESLRREQLAQELAEAAGRPEDGMMDDVQLDGAQDLDDEIPDADDQFSMGNDDDDGDEQDEDPGDDDDDDDDARDAGVTQVDDAALREERQNDLVAARMRMTDDAFREALVRGDADGDDMYGGEEGDFDEHVQGHMLDEDDFASGVAGGDDTGLDMGGDLDDDIPEAESGGYEHTDSEADYSSNGSGGEAAQAHYRDDGDESEVGRDSDDGDESEVGRDSDDGDDDGSRRDDSDDFAEDDIGFAPRTAPLGPPQSPTMPGRASARTSMDLSNLLSHDESSFMDSSPAQSRRARYG
ncbi:hypothetical protein HIM_05061 [Hirsutella minnesotensis 3608]|uniref:Anaphase-promoting complex, subunit 15/MND2 n=1 Tax=Hirsutella minnesotensis 3608 TaxID=1043627 RepID=A0A0F7ZUX0_9HYPO|nr:hypothetical protein HIM_05061 [Hirsutella minnesotensis 3608]